MLNGSSFELSDRVDKEKVFLVNLSNIEGRIDPIQFSLERVKAIETLKYHRQLTKLSKVTKSEKSVVQESVLPYVGLENIQSETGDYILTKDREGFGSANTFAEGDILFSKLRPYLNKVYLANFNGVCSTEFHVLQTSKDFSSKFLALYLRSNLILNQTKYLMTGNTLPRLQTKDIFDLPVPILEYQLQREIVQYYDTLMIERKSKIKEAGKLLASIDNYLLDQLGIKIPQMDNSLSSRIFTVQASELLELRLDPEYLAIKYRALEDVVESSQFKSLTLNDVTLFISSGKTPAKKDYVKDISKHEIVYDIIKVGSYSGDFIDSSKLGKTITPPKFNTKKGDIFILSAAHQSEYVGKHLKYLNTELLDTGCVGELICVRANIDIINKGYLFNVLKLDIFKTLINRRKTGQTSHIYPKDIRKIVIPVPSLDKQQEIIKHIDQIRATAQQLQQDAEDILATAKHQVENMILGKEG